MIIQGSGSWFSPVMPRCSRDSSRGCQLPSLLRNVPPMPARRPCFWPGSATDRQGPLAANLTAAEPALSVAVFRSPTSADAATVLGDVPDPDAQRSLAAVVLDPSQPSEIRKQSAAQLMRSIQRFGPLVSAYQEDRLAASIGEETDPDCFAAEPGSRGS